MTHKVHPKIFRIRNIADWNSQGFYKKPAFYLAEDFKIREFLNKKLEKMGIEKIEIERFPGKINIIIHTARPGLIIGRGGEGVERIKKELDKILFPLKQDKKDLRIEIREIKNPWTSASLSAQWIAQQIEKRIPFRKVLKRGLDKIITNKEIKGARVEVSGRLNGAEIARREWLKKGKLPRQTIRADIDYAQERAYCTYGIIGIKVWIYKGERFA
ncbi:MAG: 30S ribosomal protein S3 [Candidatus Nealsonbacteria bacterium]|nr:30S ribosomal protein S3 [Candidatus Nealsonbacteria bacterium]